ncbi:MAG: hypothetical protein CMQ46_05650 [Gammaproteobacteria bacterium]|nr:hypothetical protein [Gammaproteobacteria bacterium]
MAEMLLKKCGGMYAPYGDKSKQAFRKIPLGQVMRCEVKAEATGTVPMLRTWRGWMNETARHMAHMGCTMPLYIDSQATLAAVDHLTPMTLTSFSRSSGSVLMRMAGATAGQ